MLNLSPNFFLIKTCEKKRSIKKYLHLSHEVKLSFLLIYVIYKYLSSLYLIKRLYYHKTLDIIL